MSKQKQEATSDLTSTKSLIFPLIVAEKHDHGVAGETRISGDRVLRPSNRGERILAASEAAQTSSSPVQFSTLSKVVGKAFTGWTIKTQK